MADLIPLEDFALAITDLCEKEVLFADQTLDEVISKRALEVKKKLNSRSPKKTGDYSKGWRVKTATRNHEKVKVIHNAKRPDLTFILEYGNDHQPAQEHIRPTLEGEIDSITEELLNRL